MKGVEAREKDLGLRVWGSGFRILDLGQRVKSS